MKQLLIEMPKLTASDLEEVAKYNKKNGLDNLYNADPTCRHKLDNKCLSGIKCSKCSGWFCF